MKLLVTGAWPDAKKQMDGLCALGHEIVFLQQEKDPLPCDPAWPERRGRLRNFLEVAGIARIFHALCALG